MFIKFPGLASRGRLPNGTIGWTAFEPGPDRASRCSSKRSRPSGTASSPTTGSTGSSRPLNPQWYTASSYLYTEINDAIAGKTTPAKALSTACA